MEEVARQQILTAWISAGAAVIQAVGAIAAIIVAIVLARGSEKRAREADEQAHVRAILADEAAEARARAADRAAEARVEAADRAAAQREARSIDAAHDGIVDRILALGMLAVAECEEAIREMAVRYAGETGLIVGELQSPLIEDLRRILIELKAETSDTSLLASIGFLQKTTVPTRTEAFGGEAYVRQNREHLEKIDEALGAVSACRRG